MKKNAAKKPSFKTALPASSRSRRSGSPQKTAKEASQKPVRIKKKTAVTLAAAPIAAAASGSDGNLSKIDHIVVLMMENRSFDHMLGYLKLNHGHPSDGLVATMSNQFRGTTYKVHHLANTPFKPGQDPHHDGASVTEQLLNNNGGFVANYGHAYPADPEVDLPMGYYNKDDVSVLHTLSQSFCVCDRWFSSVDGATWPNRLYSIAGKAAGSKDNKSIPLYRLPSFVRHLDSRGISWNWYAHEVSTLRLVDPNYRLRKLDHFRWVEHPTKPSFLRDAAAGSLPAVSWIDPDFSDL